MPMIYQPILALLSGGSVVGTGAEAVINGILDFVTSPFFYALIAVLVLLLVLWILLRI